MEYKGFKLVFTADYVAAIGKDGEWHKFPTEAEAKEWIDEQE